MKAFSVYDSTDTKVRKFQLPGQNYVQFTKEPRFGMWSVSFAKGGIPNSLSGAWASFNDLYDLTNRYLQTREKFKCEIGEEL